MADTSKTVVLKFRCMLESPGDVKKKKKIQIPGSHYWTCCFNCGYKFKDEDYVYLVWLTNTPNRFFCKECNDKALLDLSKEVSNEKNNV